MVDFPQNVPLCLLLSAMGGIMEVFATVILAVADTQTKAGIKWSDFELRMALAGNVILQVSASMVGNLLAPWFGPVSLVGPTFLAAQLLANMLLYGVVLGLENFTKDMRIGTYIIAVGAVLLPVVGPQVQEGQDIWRLLTTIQGAIWSILVVSGMFFSGFLLLLTIHWPCSKKAKKDDDDEEDVSQKGAISIDMISRFPNEYHRIAILLVARATSFSINLTVSKMLVLDIDLTGFIIAMVLKVLSGATMTFGIIVQSVSVPQSTFVPLNASFTILINAFTGIIVWEDWKVVDGVQWLGYACVFLQFALGNYLLLGDDIQFLDSENSTYGRKETLNIIRRNSLLMRNAHVDDDGSPSHPLSSIVEEESEEEMSDHKQKHDAVGTSLHGSMTSLTRSKMWRNIYNVDDELINAGSRRRLKYVFFQNGRNARDMRNLANGRRTLSMVNLQDLRDIDHDNLTHDMDIELSPPRSKSLHV
jgi:hypothetical protein